MSANIFKKKIMLIADHKPRQWTLDDSLLYHVQGLSRDLFRGSTKPFCFIVLLLLMY